MSDIEIDFELRYVKCELADKRVESKPVLRIYYDAHFIRTEQDGGILTTYLDEDDLTKRYPGTLKAKTDYRLGNRVPATACIGIASYAMRRNDAGVACYTTAGTTHVRLGDILKNPKGFSQRFPLLMEATRLMGDPVKKGELELAVKGIRIKPHVKIIETSQCILQDALSDQNAQNMTDFINHRIEAERAIPDTWEQVKNVRAPMCISNEGVELTKTCFVPIEGFVISEPMTVNYEFFKNSYERVMIRKNLDPRTDFRLLDPYHKAEVMAEFIAIWPESCDYISDEVVTSSRSEVDVAKPAHISAFYNPRYKFPTEEFSNAAVKFAGDCEDSAKFAFMMFGAFQRQPKPTREAAPAASMISSPINSATDPLTELQQISKHYVPFMTLATVHGAKAEDNTEHIGAHMYVLLLPKSQIRAALCRNPSGKNFAETHLIGDDYLKCPPLPTLFIEGTGRVRPMGPGPVVTTIKNIVRAASIQGKVRTSYDPIINERRYVAMNFKEKDGLKMEIPHDFGQPSSFYLGNLQGITNEYLNVGVNVGAFLFGRISDQGEITRGAHFVDIINQQENFTMIPCEPVPANLMAITREAIALEVPTPEFNLDSSKPMSGEVKNPLLERLKTSINGKGRKGMSPYGSVDLFIRPHQFNSYTIDRMIANLNRMPLVWKVDYELEHITNDMHSYRLMLFVDHEGAQRE